MTRTAGQVLGEGTEVVKSLTGLDVGAILSGLAAGQLVKADPRVGRRWATTSGSSPITRS